MFNVEKLVRPNILALEAYSSARKEYQKKEGIFLDANENPFGVYNRYPDPNQNEIKELLAKQNNLETNQIFIGNGSDEVIDLAFRIFCNPGKDQAITFNPSYGMYKVSAGINNINLIQLDLDKSFNIDIQSLEPYFNNEQIKITFICSPNNPTGNLLDNSSIEYILKNMKGIVVIDEAYIDFSNQESWFQRINEFPNLIVSQTFSKAWGMAAARVGVAYAQAKTIELFQKVKPPYNVSSLSQKAIIDTLNNKDMVDQYIEMILAEKKRLIAACKTFDWIKKIYPSDSNFILIEVENANDIYQFLIQQGIIIRNRNHQIKNCLRISIGKKEENILLIQTLKNYYEKSIIYR